ncbi:MAG: ATP synthase F1 subunit delta [Chloroflexota bacterium]
MARVTAAARRYAQAVFQLALERNEIDKWGADLDACLSLAESPDLLSILENPKIPLKEKQRIIGGTLPNLAPLALNLVSLLIVKGRLAIIEQMVAEYMKMVDAHRGLERAEIVTAVALDEEDNKMLRERLAALSGKEIVLSNRVEPAIVGGLMARIGDKLIDGSTRSNLSILKKSLSGEAS